MLERKFMKRRFLRFFTSKKSFYRFLKENYGYTDVRSYTPHKRFAAGMNSIYLAKDAEGKQVFIKSCRYEDMNENEYRMGLALWKEAPEHFAKPLAYHAEPPFAFCSTEYVPGKDLYDILQQENSLTGEQKAKLIEDIYAIHQALVRSNVVHRDIVLKNMLYNNGKIVLIDCQLATKRDATKSISIYDNILKICSCRWNRPIGPKVLEWDDAISLYQAAKTIGTAPEYQERFDTILAELKQNIGKYKYIYPYPDMKELKSAIKTCRLKSRFHHQAKMRHRYSCTIKILEYLQAHHPSIETKA